MASVARFTCDQGCFEKRCSCVYHAFGLTADACVLFFVSMCDIQRATCPRLFFAFPLLLCTSLPPSPGQRGSKSLYSFNLPERGKSVLDPIQAVGHHLFNIAVRKMCTAVRSDDQLFSLSSVSCSFPFCKPVGNRSCLEESSNMSMGFSPNWRIECINHRKSR